MFLWLIDNESSERDCFRSNESSLVLTAGRVPMLIFIFAVILFVLYIAKDMLWDGQKEILRTMISQSNSTDTDV